METHQEYPCNAYFLRKALNENGVCCALLLADQMAEIIIQELGKDDTAALVKELQRRLQTQCRKRMRSSVPK